jgi:small-conductance mechanosensitive channel
MEEPTAKGNSQKMHQGNLWRNKYLLICIIFAILSLASVSLVFFVYIWDVFLILISIYFAIASIVSGIRHFIQKKELSESPECEKENKAISSKLAILGVAFFLSPFIFHFIETNITHIPDFEGWIVLSIECFAVPVGLVSFLLSWRARSIEFKRCKKSREINEVQGDAEIALAKEALKIYGRQEVRITNLSVFILLLPVLYTLWGLFLYIKLALNGD